MSVRIGINGMGRIGRSLFRLVWDAPDLQVAAVNDVADAPTLAHLLRHDSVSGRWEAPLEARDGHLVLGDRRVSTHASHSPAEIPWADTGVQLVVEASGHFRERDAAAGHLHAGAQRVIISAPSPDADLTTVVGINHENFDPHRHFVISNASCTTNCLCPVLKVVDEGVGIEAGSMTTVHCYTNDQPLMDAPHQDLRRARAAGVSMIPTTTSASLALRAVQPDLADRITCLAVRVPTANVSAVDLALATRRDLDLEEARDLFRAAEQGPLKGILGYTEEPLVSIDYRGETRSAVVDGGLLALPSSRFLKIFAWYDNEVGYTHRLVDLIRYLVQREGVNP